MILQTKKKTVIILRKCVNMQHSIWFKMPKHKDIGLGQVVICSYNCMNRWPCHYNKHIWNIDNALGVGYSVRNCCLSCSHKRVDLMEDQQLYNLDGPLDQQHFTVTKLQCKKSLHFSNIYHVFYKFILWRTTHFFGGPTVFLNNWSLVKVEHWLGSVFGSSKYFIL